MLHCDPGVPLIIGEGVVVGHKALIHGCTIEDDVLIGMGSIVMNKAHIGRGSIVGAGAVVLEGFACEPYSLVVGSPAKVKKVYDGSIVERIRKNARSYQERSKYYQQSMQTTESRPQHNWPLIVGAALAGAAAGAFGVLRRSA